MYCILCYPHCWRDPHDFIAATSVLLVISLSWLLLELFLLSSIIYDKHYYVLPFLNLFKPSVTTTIWCYQYLYYCIKISQH